MSLTVEMIEHPIRMTVVHDGYRQPSLNRVYSE